MCSTMRLVVKVQGIFARIHLTHEFVKMFGHLDLSCDWSKQRGCPRNNIPCTGSGGGKTFSCFHWARQNWCESKWKTCPTGAKGGHLAIFPLVR